MEFGIPCFYIVLLLVALPLIGRWILSPFAEATRFLHAPRRFLLSDFIWLFVLLQASLATARLAMDETPAFVIILVFLILASVAIWGGAVSALSRAGVAQSLQRGVFVLVLLPAVLALMGAVVVELGALTALSVVFLGIRGAPQPELGLYFAPLGIPAIVLAAWALRQLTRWVVAGASSPDVSEKDRELEAQGQISPTAQTPTWEPEREGVAGDNSFSESFSGNKKNESN